ncbi:MAG: carbohydrate kinase family protein [Oscillospiraceae bacterium]|nr:carbohydrate kinase family protein [Oscillospiraceae bacterium]
MVPKFDLICTGMALVDSIIKGFDPDPISASGYRADSGSLNVGGEAVNESIAASKLGMHAGILCALGNDGAGDLVENELRKNGVDISLLVRPEGHQTPVTTMFVRDDGGRQSITNRAHTANFHPERYTSCFHDTRALILGSLFRAPFDDPEIIFNVVKDAKKAGVLVVADTKLPNFRFLTLDDIRDSLPMIDYITPNEDEARHFTGKENPEEMADVLLGYDVKNVIIKMGGKGCLYRNSGESVMLPAFDIDAADATGAGDNFVAGFVSELIRGSAVIDALKFANACGAICTTAVGANTALKSREQVIRFIDEYGNE